MQVMDSESKPKVTWAEAFRDLGLRMIDKGQWAAFIAGIIIFTFVVRVDSDELLSQARELFSWTTLPWVLFLLSIIGWYVHVRFVDNTTKGENQRLGIEKANLQERLTAMQEELESIQQDSPVKPEKL